jgi:nitroimidazol reductase NimA-like FMN-containing flavoprotein (pyridoxamine 5'-phosphate oxidase superfamily)
VPVNIREMNDDECIALIDSQRIGRLGCCKEDRPYIVPVHYVCSGKLIFSFSMPGQKMDFMRHNPNVCIQIEHIDRSDTWKCVLVQGIFHEFTSPEGQQEAWKILQTHNDWWEVGGQSVLHGEHEGERKPTFFSVTMDLVTGRVAGEA